MKKEKHIIFIKTFIVLVIMLFQTSLLVAADLPTDLSSYYELTYTKVNSGEFELQTITVQNPYGDNNESLNEGSFTDHYGYYAGQVVIDFNKGLYKLTESPYYDQGYGNIYPPHFVLKNGGRYDESQNTYRPKMYITDVDTYNTYKNNQGYGDNRNPNLSGVSVYIKVTQKDSNGTIKNTLWYNYTEVWYSDLYDILGDFSSDSLTLDYYFTINNIEKLKTNEQLYLIVPSFSTQNEARYLFKADTWVLSDAYESDPIMSSSIYQMGALGNYDNPYSLDVSLSKLFSSSDDFFDGNYHDYYKMTIKLYRSQVSIDDNYNVSFQVSSKNDFNLYKDGDDTTDNSKIIPYNLYLKYHMATNNSYQYELIDDNDIFLLRNMNNNNSTSKLYLTTLSTSASPTLNDKGTYQDTIYLNFITDSIYSDNANYTKLIDL
ncbi:MAG: hypothetical protein ACRQFF_04710 [Sphaerochaeta sp.]